VPLCAAGAGARPVRRAPLSLAAATEALSPCITSSFSCRPPCRLPCHRPFLLPAPLRAPTGTGSPRTALRCGAAHAWTALPESHGARTAPLRGGRARGACSRCERRASFLICLPSKKSFMASGGSTSCTTSASLTEPTSPSCTCALPGAAVSGAVRLISRAARHCPCEHRSSRKPTDAGADGAFRNPSGSSLAKGALVSS